MSEADREAPSCPQPSNRGAEMTIRVDYLAFTVRGMTVAVVQERLLEWVPGEFVELDYGSSSYERQAVGAGGARVKWTAGRDDIHIVLPGKWLGALAPEAVLGVLAWVNEKAWYVVQHEDGSFKARVAVTRLDLAADDFAKVVTPGQVEAARAAGNLVTHAKEGEFIRHWPTRGETFALGKRGSLQYLRVYDKAAESGGEIDSIRWELEFRDEAAESALVMLLYREWGEVFATRLVSFVDFRDRSADARPDRCPRLPWLEQVVGAAEKVKPYELITPVASAERSLSWLRHQVAAVLAAVNAAAGGDLGLLESLLEEGRNRWKASHRLIASQDLEWQPRSDVPPP
jgi:hypothetical protein